MRKKGVFGNGNVSASSLYKVTHFRAFGLLRGFGSTVEKQIYFPLLTLKINLIMQTLMLLFSSVILHLSILDLRYIQDAQICEEVNNKLGV